MTLRPIRNDDDHAAAVAEIERLWKAEPGSPDHDLLEVLATLVDAYEAARWPIDPPDPASAIRFHMEQTGLRQADLARLLNSSSRASEILSGKRALTVEMIWALNRKWGIPAESLIRPPRPNAA